MEVIKLHSTVSTNSWLSENESNLSSGTLVYALQQTGGRGQKGNSWESEPGKNITASLLFRPQNFEASQQFIISEAIALAIVDFLKGEGVESKIKWPNDIYAAKKKICGILVENVVMGKNISRTIAGFGININQTEFLSDAPNPVSLAQITGLSYNIDALIIKLCSFLNTYLKKIEDSTQLHKDFLTHLWRNDGRFYQFFDHKNVENIEARIISVRKDGILILETSQGDQREYMFKEIEFKL